MTTPLSDSTERKDEHQILGTKSSFISGRYEVLSDIKVNNLQVRHLRSMDPTICATGSQHAEHIEMNGPINPDTPFIIAKLLEKIDASPSLCYAKTGEKVAVTVFLNSGGGYMRDGYELGELFRKNQVATEIAFNGECYSSCATAFLGGKYRTMGENSALLFHAPYIITGSDDIACLRSDKKLVSFMKDMLGSDKGTFLYKRTMSFCSTTSGWSLNKDAAEVFGLIN